METRVTWSGFQIDIVAYWLNQDTENTGGTRGATEGLQALKPHKPLSTREKIMTCQRRESTV